MEGGTVFHFVTGDLEEALEAAYQAADGQDVRLAGGASTIQQYLRAGLVDEMHLAYAPMLLGSGERLWMTSTRRRMGMRSQTLWVRQRLCMSGLCGRLDP